MCRFFLREVEVGEGAEESCGHFVVCDGGVDLVLEVTEVVASAAAVDLGDPFPVFFSPADALVRRGSSGGAAVPHILSGGAEAEVASFIVEGVCVDVVDY